MFQRFSKLSSLYMETEYSVRPMNMALDLTRISRDPGTESDGQYNDNNANIQQVRLPLFGRADRLDLLQTEGLLDFSG